jgi:hypothetical protein
MVAALAADRRNAQISLKRSVAAEAEAKRHLDSHARRICHAHGQERPRSKPSLPSTATATESVRKLFHLGSTARRDGARRECSPTFLEVEDRYEACRRRFPARRIELHRGEVVGCCRRRPALAAHRRRRPRNLPVHPEDSQAKFSFDFNESMHHVSARRYRASAQELHSRARTALASRWK